MTIILQKTASGAHYSLESGIADNIKNFDHHKTEHRKFPSPSNNENIPRIDLDKEVVEISHIDADTFIGLLRLAGKNLPNIDLSVVEKIDLNGSSVIEDNFDRALLYMIGIGDYARSIKFPRVTDDPQDVTDFIEAMFEKADEEYIAIGRQSQEVLEEHYRRLRKEAYSQQYEELPFSNKILFTIDSADIFDPSRAYKDGYEVVLVFRKHYKSLSIYCNPTSKEQYGGRTIANLEFGGHPKACGSPRGYEMTEQKVLEVWNEIR